jgi:hypothetical protein
MCKSLGDTGNQVLMVKSGRKWEELRLANTRKSTRIEELIRDVLTSTRTRAELDHTARP